MPVLPGMHVPGLRVRKGKVNGMAEFTHFNENGEAFMVDVSGKAETVREAAACGTIVVSPECFEKIRKQETGKGDVLGCARIAGIMGAKRTAELIPLCHILSLTKVEITFEAREADCSITAFCRVKTVGKTGAEMEALTGVNIALLTVYDMCKAVDKRMHMENIHLCEKTGGKSGSFRW